MSGNRFTTYAPKGKGVTLSRRESVTERVYSISGITPEGKLYDDVQKLPYNSARVIRFLNQLLDQIPGQVHLVWDNASIHKSKEIKQFLNQPTPRDRLTLYALPIYSPDLNPDEQVWNHLKNHILIRQEFDSRQQLGQAVRIGMSEIRDRTHLIQSFFRHKKVGFIDS